VAVGSRCSRASYWQILIFQTERPQWKTRYSEWMLWSTHPQCQELVDYGYPFDQIRDHALVAGPLEATAGIWRAF
jgi:hypothetical protein